MSWTQLNLAVATPEIFLLVAALIVLLSDIFLNERNKSIAYGLTLAALAGTAYLLLQSAGQSPRPGFNGMFIADPLSQAAKFGMVIGVALMLVYGRSYARLRGIFRGELFALSLFALLGMMVMASGANFVTLYIGLELLSLSLYALVAMQRNNVHATEAAMKYFVLGALASGLLLYGMSMVYGATGALDIPTISQRITVHGANNLLAIFGLVFIVTGIGFKLGAVPFHMWVPDVYDGAPTLLTQLIGSAPKLAAFAFTFRLLAEALAGYKPDWSSMLTILAVLSLVVGNVAAIAQTRLKRMLAYSTISHMGFLLLGFMAGTRDGYAASFFYAMSYMLTAAASFGMIMLLSGKDFEADQIADFKGLAKRDPWFAAMMLIVMFSMAGIPVFVGFFAKFAVLKAVISTGAIWLAVLAVACSLIGAFYYLRVVKVMYFDEPENQAPIAAAPDSRILLSVNCLLLLLLGLLPDRLLTVLTEAVQRSMLP
ncbi:NADH-quinone oxidoreductase subunit N [Formivibrio citricus]|uniref:NADH-quinone oxidoreductase subunit N n=1 Tax=Formivibrio citricus TaxID=83765 RepID=A0A1I4WX21_9NEIS|nr:NADH-quinone oxidoreductase subunit NuoN [Formivibrio citricus]SFN18301.1 NADH-quinone oxidoreductase subunit N [Formivibrio citricus]